MNRTPKKIADRKRVHPEEFCANCGGYMAGADVCCTDPEPLPPVSERERDDEMRALQKYSANAVVPAAGTWMDADPAQLKTALEARSKNRTAMLGWIWDNLVDGIDYGRIHVVKDCKNKKSGCDDPTHFSKPSLWKPGAEKITGMLGMRAVWPEMVDEMRAAAAQGAKHVVLRCELLDPTGRVVGEGIGARSIDREYGDINKALKMAKKSSLIDAVLVTAGLSEIFTQDDAETEPDGTIDDTGQTYLLEHAQSLFADDAEQILQALARRRFKFSDGNWRRIPAYRLQDAIRSLDEKAEADNAAPDHDVPEPPADDDDGEDTT